MTETVTVACKLPNGLHMDVEGMGRVTLAGNVAPFGQQTQTQVIGSYSLNRDVPKDFWDRWIEENKDYPPVKNNLVFALMKPADAAAKAKEQSEVKSGLEPIDKDKPGKGISPGVRPPGSQGL